MSGQRGNQRGYARTARVNEVLRQVLAESLERMEELDERLGMLTITAVQCDPDLRHATVLFSSLTEPAIQALEEHRVALQAEIGRGGRMKRTPTLRFLPDPAIAAGARVEDAIRRIHRDEP